MGESEQLKREAVVRHCRAMNTTGLNQGTSGNISIRHKDGLLISPASHPYNTLTPDDIIFLGMDGVSSGKWDPSSEWRFHRDILKSRPEMNAVVHAHPTYCTALSVLSMEIPAIHYMIAVFGGPNIRCAPYEIYGSDELSQIAIKALEDRKACLLAHHGMISAGSSIEQAFWLAEELEALARQYHTALQINPNPPLLSDSQIQDVIDKINGYGLTDEK